jgi:hypothetical protein
MPVVAAVLAASVTTVLACRPAPRSGPQRLVVRSANYAVEGDYRLVPLDRIDGVANANGALVLKGAPADLPIDAPADADLASPTRRWALVTDARVEGHRLITFTESERVEDVSVELPESDGPVYFASFAARGGGEVLVFATGDSGNDQARLFGHITIRPR